MTDDNSPSADPPRPPVQPTEEGRRRYGAVGGYKGVPCTCTERCPNPCDGARCGCSACSYAFSEFMSGSW